MFFGKAMESGSWSTAATDWGKMFSKNELNSTVFFLKSVTSSFS